MCFPKFLEFLHKAKQNKQSTGTQIGLRNIMTHMSILHIIKTLTISSLKKKKKNKTLTFALLTPKFSTESFDKTAFFTTHFALQNHGTASLNYCDLLTGSRKMKDSHQDKENK